MKPSIVPATAEHIPAIAAHVRPADRDEMWALSCQTPDSVLRSALAASDFARTGMVDDIPVCMFGVVSTSLLSRTGRPWMIGTVHLEKWAMIFLRRCGGQVREMLSGYRILENFVDVRNARSIEWLDWLGFNIDIREERLGPFALPFVRFYMENRA